MGEEPEKIEETPDRTDVVEGIRRGLADVEAGRTVPLAELEAAVRVRFGRDAER